MDSSTQSAWINKYIPFLGTTLTENGQIKAEWFGNLDSVMIIIFQVLISYIIMRMKQVSALIRGTVIATLGVVLTFVFNNVWFTIIGTAIFATGEMMAGPTLYAYVAQITPLSGYLVFTCGSGQLPHRLCYRQPLPALVG